jgi:antirestriction protein ArdC
MISPHMPRGEYQSRYEGPSREERVSAAVETLEHGIDSILTGEDFAAYLKTLAQFHQYSFGNVMLIRMQRPDATRVAGYRKWQELGRQVRKGEAGIKILVPHLQRIKPDTETGEEIPDIRRLRGFGVGTVFDVAQTDGEPLPEPPRPGELSSSSEHGAALTAGVMQFLQEQGVPVVREDTRPAHGYYDPINRTIGLDERLEGNQAAKTLVHEAAHFVASHTLGMDTRDAETVAESAAFVVLNHAGIDSSEYSFAYVAHWAQDRTVLKRNLDAIQKTAHHLIDALEQSGTLADYDSETPQSAGQDEGKSDRRHVPQDGAAEYQQPEEPTPEPQQHTIWEVESFVGGFEERRLPDPALDAIERDLARKGIKGRFVRRDDA